MSEMKTKRLPAVIIALCVLVGACFWLGRKPEIQSVDGISASTPGQNQSRPLASQQEVTAEQALQSAADRLISAIGSDEKKTALEQLREAIATGATNEVSVAIRKLLDSKLDAPTGLGFKVGGGGDLLEAPTLRIWLLDQLARHDPAAASAYAREILNFSESPDEWAVALRNLARGDTNADTRSLLEVKTGNLLRNEAWQGDPSVGYLEAFDTAVHLGGTTLLSPLTELVIKKDNQAVAHAAFLTLDRLVINQPTEILAALNEHPEWMAGREDTRANYFARADVGDAAQRQLVEEYLLDSTRDAKELDTFAGVFPNANFMISHNLLTENKTVDGRTLQQRDLAAKAVVNQWLDDPRFERLKKPLMAMRQRLEEFTRHTE